MPKFLKDIFSRLAHRKAADAAQIQKQENLKTLCDWVDKTTGEVAAQLDKQLDLLRDKKGCDVIQSLAMKTSSSQNIFIVTPVEKGEGKYKNCPSFSWVRDFDVAQLTRADLAEQAARFEKLHDLALSYNVSLKITGFDMLPSIGLSHDNGWHRGPGVGIAIDTKKPYNIFSHPRYGQQGYDKVLKERQNQWLQKNSRVTAVTKPYKISKP